MPLILASASPRRRELLQQAGLAFEILISPAEEIHDETMTPQALCEYNADLKASAVAADYPQDTIIGADTLVFIDGNPLGKPADFPEAHRMLRSLAGRTHQVCTGVCIIRPEGKTVFHDITEVDFRPLSAEEIEAYTALVNPFDKAGAYGIQEHGERIISGIRGSFANVMGLPVEKLMEILKPEEKVMVR